jgi:DNA-binding transcriptional MocR family regulator
MVLRGVDGYTKARQYPYNGGKMSQGKPMQEDEAATLWVGRFARGDGPRYLQIVTFIERAVAEGRLTPGDRLPPQRELARLLHVDLTTVTRAYTEAKRRNLLEARGARGTYVSAPMVDLAQGIDLRMNIPPSPADVDLGDLLKHGLSQVLLRNDAALLMTYHLAGGGKSDRKAGATWLTPMFGTVDAERVVVCSSAQAALAALILALTQPGDAIITEPLIYPGLRLAAAHLGRRIVAVDTDDDGLRPDALEEACREHRARLIYLNPTLQNPTTLTMPEHRRRDIALTATRCGAKIIEDDPYWLLADSAPAPVAQFAPEQVYYLATLSKCLTPGLRTAFLLLPDAQSQYTFLTALRSFALMATPLTTALATQWIYDGSAARLLAGIQSEARSRMDLARQFLLAGAPRVPTGAIHVWHTLPSYWTSLDFARVALAQGLAVTPSDAFYAAGLNPPNAIRISLGGAKDRARLADALATLSTLLARRPSLDTEYLV